MLVSNLSPELSSSTKAPVLPTNPVSTTSALVGKAYSAAGQAAAYLHTMSLLQAYQAELLADFDEGGAIGLNAVCELCRATDLSLRAAKETAKSNGRSMAALVATERHLWLNLSNVKGKCKNFLMDAPISSSGLFGDAVNSVVKRFQETAKQAAAFQKLLPRHTPISGAAEQREQPQTSKASASYAGFGAWLIAWLIVLPHLKTGDMVSTLNRSLRRVKRIWGPLSFLRGLRGRGLDARSLRPMRTPPPRSRAINTSFYGAHLPSLFSGDHATSCASGHSVLWRLLISGSTRIRSGPGMLAPSEEAFRAVSSDVSCQLAVSGCRSDSTITYKSRNQSREAGNSSRIFDSVDTSAKYISLGPADCRKRVSNTVRVSPAPVHGGVVHRGDPPAGSGNGTRNESFVRERGQRICTSLQQGNQVLQPVFHSSKEGWGFRPILDLRVLNNSVMQLKFKMLTLRQIVSQIRSEDWFVTIYLKDTYFHISILPCHRKFLRFAFGGRAYQYRVLPFGLALSHRTFTKCINAALAPLRLRVFAQWATLTIGWF